MASLFSLTVVVTSDSLVDFRMVALVLLVSILSSSPFCFGVSARRVEHDNRCDGFKKGTWYCETCLEVWVASFRRRGGGGGGSGMCDWNAATTLVRVIIVITVSTFVTRLFLFIIRLWRCAISVVILLECRLAIIADIICFSIRY
jgi:hypothetical protein